MLLRKDKLLAVESLIYMIKEDKKNGCKKVHKSIDISNSLLISHCFLEQILRLLRSKNIIKAVKGPNGGYIIERNYEDISIYNIITALDPDINFREKVKLNTRESIILDNMYKKLNILVKDHMESVTLRDLTKSVS